MFHSILAICIGASLGAVLRWFLGISFNALFPAIPPGTLVANLIGGYLIGVALALFAESSRTGARVALIHHHRLPGWTHHFPHLFCRNSDTHSTGAATLGSRRHRLTCDGIIVDDDARASDDFTVQERLNSRKQDYARLSINFSYPAVPPTWWFTLRRVVIAGSA